MEPDHGEGIVAAGGSLEADSGALERAIVGLAELGLRICMVAERFRVVPPPILAPVLDQLAERAHTGQARAREAVLPLALFLAREPKQALAELRRLASETPYLHLERMLRHAPSELHPSEDPRLPVYRKDRELSLGERRSLARRPTRLEIDRLVADPHPLVLEALLASSQIKEEDALKMATRRPLHLAASHALLHSDKFIQRSRIRLALILNPYCLDTVSVPLLSTLTRDALLSVERSSDLASGLRAIAHELASHLPPFSLNESSWLH